MNNIYLFENEIYVGRESVCVCDVVYELELLNYHWVLSVDESLGKILKTSK